MKKALLLLGMIGLIAGCICIKNADMDTILSKEYIKDSAVYIKEYPIEYTEETIKSEEAVKTEETIKSEEAVKTEETIKSQEAVKTEETVISEETAEEEIINAGGYAFLKLNPSEQAVYLEILNSLMHYEEETRLSTIDTALIDKAFNCVMLDHPEIFYIDGYKYTEYTRNDTVNKIVFSGNYLYDEDEKNRRLSEIEKAAQNIIERIPDTEDEYEIVKFLYDTLVEETEYDLGAADNQNICSVLLKGRSVCQGYAKTMQFLLQKLGIEGVLVLGKVTGGEGHAWNLVSVNEQWYYLDATWGDAFYLFSEEQTVAAEAEFGLINYDYLCVTTEQLCKTHSINMPVAMPECTSMKDNYYVREGLYFQAFSEEEVKHVFEKAIAEGWETVTIKCSDGAVYEEMTGILLEEQKIFEYLSTDNPVAYTDNKEQCSLTFWL